MAERITLAALQVRRARLLQRSAWLRDDLQSQVSALARPPAWIQQVQQGFGWLRAHPQWLLGGAALLLVARPRRTLRWGGRMLAAWQFVQRTGPVWLRLWERWSAQRRR